MILLVVLNFDLSRAYSRNMRAFAWLQELGARLWLWWLMSLLESQIERSFTTCHKLKPFLRLNGHVLAFRFDCRGRILCNLPA